MADYSKSEEESNPAVDTSAQPESTVVEEKVSKDAEVDEKEKIKREATLLFLQGKRSIYIRDFQAAVASLSESCQLFCKIYPEQDDALADPYFYYGKALLEVGRSESEVLGDQIQENEGDEDDDEYDGDEVAENADENTSEANENGISSDEKTTANHETNNDKESPENKEENTDNENENGDINDLQLSWEYLELAKLIYLRKADTCKETAIKLAETYLCLGENGLESENYSVAVEDIKQALSLQQKHLSEVDRRIAETYYQLGIANSLCQNYDEAVVNFEKAIESLSKKISSLQLRKQMGDKKTAEEEKDAFYTMDGEIEEIEVVIKDIREKIKDMIDSKNQMKAELLKQVVSSGSQQGSSSSSSSTDVRPISNIPATDISHLIKKKRKTDEEEQVPEKKAKVDE